VSKLKLTREQLSYFLKDQQAIRQFELMISAINDLGDGIVSSFSAGTTGLTPVAATNGAVVLDGVLDIAHGGTGASSASAAPFAAKGTNSDIDSLNGVDYIAFDTAASVADDVARVRWDSAQDALAYLMSANVLCRIGQSMLAKVTNAESVTITKGQAVYLHAAQGDRATVKLAYNTSDATSAKTFGLAAEDIAANQIGHVMCQGVLEGLNLGAYSAGDTLYLGATAGTYTSTKPQAPNHMVYVGIVERANAGNGQIYVKIQNGYELDEIHDVQITGLADRHTLQYSASAGVWRNVVSQLANTATTSGTSSATVSGLPAGTAAKSCQWLEVQVNNAGYWLPIWAK
jgi:hypothetical protein